MWLAVADDTSTAKVYKIGPTHYEADIYAHGHKLDTLTAKGHTAHGENNGLHVTLHVTSCVEDAPQPQPGTGDAKPTPLPGGDHGKNGTAQAAQAE
ncbi:hypothetical protein [Streptomyces broussonetiae]|uniref:Uncharacterized protein n=1 Tax=Streptomyces broussonetiae TaxID=2686304 RepID=A0A6I6MTW0_9ACTN|nr:hypothetical protein [Streptomyces broussonetiae]QHA02902.1 hypothetical protein GQF42_06050 [Streptomyces broussonetiae]